MHRHRNDHPIQNPVRLITSIGRHTDDVSLLSDSRCSCAGVAGLDIDVLHGQPAATPCPGLPAIDPKCVDGHGQQVLKQPRTRAAYQSHQKNQVRVGTCKATSGSPPMTWSRSGQ